MYTAAVLSLPVLAAGVSAQALNATYAKGLLDSLIANNLTSLATAAQSLASSSMGPSFLTRLANGRNTLIAPDNGAFGRLPSNVTSNTDLVQATLTYHAISGAYDLATFATSPNHTITRSFMNNTNYVNLEGGQPQVIVWAYDNSTLRVRNQDVPVTITNTFTYENLDIHVASDVIEIPGTFTDRLSHYNLTGFSDVVNTAGLRSNWENTRGITIFAPANDAFRVAQANLTGITPTGLVNVLNNHIINGTTVYSTQLTQGQYTTAAGEPLKFFINNGAMYVQSGTILATIIQSDIIMKNGVLHIVDTVITNNATNTQAASSAYNGYTQSAATAGIATVPVGSSSAPAQQTGGSSSSNSAAASHWQTAAWQLSLTAVGVVFGAALLI